MDLTKPISSKVARPKIMRPSTRTTVQKDDNLSRHIGQRLKCLRIYNNVTQTELGNVLGVTFQQVQKYERGYNDIRPEKLLAIAKAFKVSIHYFFEGFQDYETHLRSMSSITTPNMSGAREAGSTIQLRLAVEFARIKAPELRIALLNLMKSLSAED